MVAEEAVVEPLALEVLVVVELVIQQPPQLVQQIPVVVGVVLKAHQEREVQVL